MRKTSLADTSAGRLRRAATCLAFGLVAAAGAQAQVASLVSGNGVAVDTDDIRAAMQRIPAASRAAVLARPDNVRRQSEDIYVRRVLAGEAERDGLNKDPVVVALLRQARERILSDARLAEIDLAGTPSDDLVSRYARETYAANPDRFRTPAQTRASHILIGRSADGNARERAEEVLAQLKAGASFEQLARTRSSDFASAQKGGDLGWFAQGQMVPEFEAAVAALKNPGEISDVIETPFGYHIVRLDGRRDAGIRSFDEVREELEREVRLKAQNEARQKKVEALLAGATVNQEAIEAFSRQYQQSR